MFDPKQTQSECKDSFIQTDNKKKKTLVCMDLHYPAFSRLHHLHSHSRPACPLPSAKQAKGR